MLMYINLIFLFKNFLKKNNIIMGLFLYIIFFKIINQYNSCVHNITTYYQIISYLNSKNNIYVITVIVYLLCLYKFNKTNYISTIFFLISIYEYNITDNINITYICIWEKSENLINMNLINGVMLIHPILLYTYYSYFFYFLYLLKKKIIKNNKKKNNLDENKFTIILICFFILVSILLGCWWAEQELSWGGWWSWDFVELIALNYLLVNLTLIHLSWKINTKYNLNKFIFIFNLIVLGIIFVRFNVINSVHNFISLDITNQYYWYILMYTFMNIFIYFQKWNNYIILKNFKKKLNFFKSPNFLIKTFIFFFFLISFINIYTNINIPIKVLYTILILIIFVIFFNKYILLLNTCNVYIIFLIFLQNIYTNNSFINLFLFLTLFLFFINIKFFYEKKFHGILLLIFLCNFNQIYFFSTNTVINNYNYNLILLNLNTYINNIYVNKINQTTLFDMDFIKTSIYFLKSFLKNNFAYIDDTYKSIFEKKIFFKGFSCMEIYNYNNQEFLFLFFLFLFFLFLFFLFLFFLFLFFTVKKKINL